MWWGLGLCLILLTSCNSKKYLKEGESFLFDNEIKIKSKDKVDDAPDLKEKLPSLYRQQKTRTVFGIPRHVFYYQYLESLEKRPERKKWSEERLIKNKPVIYDSIKTDLTSTDFVKYLALRGYREATSTYKAKTDDRKTTVVYTVNPGPRLYIDSMVFATNDSNFQSIINNNLKETNLAEGKPLDIELFNKEKSRLVGLFQNEGYFRFDETFIPNLEVDTARQNVTAIMRILNPTDSTFHQKYYVGDITVYPNYSLTDTSFLYDTLIRNVLYISPERELSLKPEAIERNIFLHEGDLTRKENFQQTLRNLSRMELIKFVTPSFEADTLSIDTPRINYTLFLTRNKKINLGSGVELTYANISETKRALLGTAANANYRDLNLWKGAEILGISADGGVEFNFFGAENSEDDIGLINSVTIGLGTDLSFPRFIDPFRLYHMIGHSKNDDEPALMGNRLRRWLLYDANTRINLSGNYVSIRQLYDYRLINMNFSYFMKPDNYRSLNLTRFGFELFVPTPTDSFRINVLDKSRFQAESFNKYLLSGLLFRSYSFGFDAAPKRQGGYIKLDHSFELSGLEVLAINKLYNAISKNDVEFSLGKENPITPESELIKFSQFAKGEVDFRYFYNINSKTQLVFRFNTGIALPLTKTQSVPYVRQFYVGGPLSNRAWQVRELGPGGYKDENAEQIAFAFYQTGDIKLDMAVEMRFPMFWYFEGALFMDAANVWTSRFEESRPDAEFEFNRFLTELGVGYGFGLRLNLDFFILRFDLGYKLLSPYKLDETNSKLYPNQFPKYPTLQFGVGLPFN